MSPAHVRFEKSFLAFRSEAGTDNVDSLLFRLSPDHDDQTANDQPDGDETLLRLGMLLVKDFEVVARPEEILGFLE